MFVTKLTQKTLATAVAFSRSTIRCLCPHSARGSKLKIMTATTDLAALAQEIGGTQWMWNPSAPRLSGPALRSKPSPAFFSSVRPRRISSSSFGLELEIGWLPPFDYASPPIRKIPGRRAGYLTPLALQEFWKFDRAR